MKDALSSDQRVLKRATGTRWSAKFDAVDALNSNIFEVEKVVLKIINDDQTSGENKSLNRCTQRIVQIREHFNA